jgi:hypothetical protein
LIYLFIYQIFYYYYEVYIYRQTNKQTNNRLMSEVVGLLISKGLELCRQHVAAFSICAGSYVVANYVGGELNTLTPPEAVARALGSLMKTLPAETARLSSHGGVPNGRTALDTKALLYGLLGDLASLFSQYDVIHSQSHDSPDGLGLGYKWASTMGSVEARLKEIEGITDTDYSVANVEPIRSVTMDMTKFTYQVLRL